MTGSIAANTTLVGGIDAQISLAGVTTGASTLAARLELPGADALSGTVAATSEVAGELTSELGYGGHHYCGVRCYK